MMARPESVWDLDTQEVHGGQTWRVLGQKLVADFSVTTNALDAPTKAVKAAADSLQHIHHYPPADCREAVTALGAFLRWPPEQLLLGNGASEFIDLVMRAAPPGPFRPGPYPAAYMEYNRAAKAAGRTVLNPHPASAEQTVAAITVIIRPNSPTSDFMPLPELEQLLQQLPTDGSSSPSSPFAPPVVVVDESFIAFHGPRWREQSALQLVAKYPDNLLVLTSWTKLWSCPGLRLGSIAASPAWTHRLKRLQTPWSCSVPAQAFLVAACADRDYLERTWATLPQWKAQTIQRVRALGWKVVNEKESHLWVPWVFVDCGDAETAHVATEVAHEAGCPIRPCGSFDMPEWIRIGVRAPEAQDVLFKALSEMPGLMRKGKSSTVGGQEDSSVHHAGQDAGPATRVASTAELGSSLIIVSGTK